MKNILLAIIGLFLAVNNISAAHTLSLEFIRAAYAGSKNFDPSMENALGDLRIGKLEHVSMGQVPASPTNYSDVHQVVSWKNFVSTPKGSSVRVYNGQLNPSGQFQDEQGLCLTLLVHAIADNGDGISLSQLVVSLSSGDPQNSLGYNPTFINKAYDKQAIGVKADGSILDTLEDGTTLVHEILIRVSGPMYTGETQDQITGIANYIQGFDDFTYSAQVSIGTGSDKVTETKVVSTHLPIFADPLLSISLESDGRVTVKVLEGASDFVYLQRCANLAQPQWETIGRYPVDYSMTRIVSDDAREFFRAVND
jgi:hypothetical protein